MPKMIAVARVDRSKERENWVEQHNAMFGQYGIVEAAMFSPEDPNQIAIIANVSDLDGLRAATRTPEGDAFMRDMGFVEQLCYFLEGDRP